MDFVLELLRRYETHGWALYKDGRWKFTPKGFIISSTLIGELLDAQMRQRTQISRPWQTQSASEETQMTLFDKRPVASGLFGGRRLAGQHE